MKRMDYSKIAENSLIMLTDNMSYVVYRILNSFLSDGENLSPPEIWDEAVSSLRLFISNARAKEALDILTYQLRQRYSSFDDNQRSAEEVDMSIFLVFNTMLFILSVLEDGNEQTSKHKELLSNLLCQHPLTCKFVELAQQIEQEMEINWRCAFHDDYLKTCYPKEAVKELIKPETWEELIELIITKIFKVGENGKPFLQNYMGGATHHEQNNTIIIDQDKMKLKEFLQNILQEDEQFVSHLSSDNQQDEVKTKPTDYVQPKQETFIVRLKYIMRDAAKHNNKTIRKKPRGYQSSYVFYLNAEAFCNALDEFEAKEREYLMHFLEGNIYNVQINKVGYFIGQTINMHIINQQCMQATDIVFAFKKFYDKDSSIRSSLSSKPKDHDYKLMMLEFEKYLRRQVL